MASPVITFLSDYGHGDEFVGVCHGVMARGCPQARIIDLTHGVARHDVRAGALALAHCLPFVPSGVHLAVVDPTVGGTGRHARRAVAVLAHAQRRVLVGPDNGLLAPALAALGGAQEAVDIGRSTHRLSPMSSTFHGRDLFAPVAAALAGGVTLASVGQPLDVAELRALELPHAEVMSGGLRVHALSIDHFGNVTLDATHEQLVAAGAQLGATLALERPGAPGGAAVSLRYVATFADVAPGETLLYEDAWGLAAVAVNRDSAAERLRIARDDVLQLRVC